MCVPFVCVDGGSEEVGVWMRVGGLVCVCVCVCGWGVEGVVCLCASVEVISSGVPSFKRSD